MQTFENGKCAACQVVANVTGSNLFDDLVLVPLQIATNFTGHTPPWLLPPRSAGVGSSSPAPAPSSKVRMLEVRTRPWDHI